MLISGCNERMVIFIYVYEAWTHSRRRGRAERADLSRLQLMNGNEIYMGKTLMKRTRRIVPVLPLRYRKQGKRVRDCCEKYSEAAA